MSHNNSKHTLAAGNSAPLKIYIAGKISGLKWSEVTSKFKDTATRLREAGHIALCPVEMFPENAVWDWAEYMLTDLRLIWNHADAVLMLHDWQDSKGAKLEHHAAEAADKPIYYSLDEVPGVSQ